MQLYYFSRQAVDDWLVEGLRQMGHVVAVGEWSAEAAAQAAEDGFDLILADAARAEPDGVAELAAELPILAFVDQADARERARLLRAGADACFVRPLHLIEVQTRLMALARLLDRQRASAAAEAGLQLDRAARRLRLGDRASALSPGEFQLVTYMLRREGQVIAAAVLDRQLAGEAEEPRPERIRGLVSRLRRKFETELGEPLIHSVRGHGYVLRLRDDPD